MHSHDIRLPLGSGAAVAKSRTHQQAVFKSGTKPTGEVDMEPRVVELETHLKYIRRDMEEVRGDVKSIKHRLAYSMGATAVILGLLGWVANSRFDQLVSLLAN
jgi:hypothetical protein